MRRTGTEASLLDPSRRASFVILALAWPTIAEQLLQVMVTFVDSAMVGSLGATATASVAVPMSTIWLVSGWMHGFSIGFGVLMARNLGAGNSERARTIVGQALVTALPFGVLLTALFVIVARLLPTWITTDEQVVAGAQHYFHYIALGYLPNLLMILISSLLRLSGDTKTPLLLNGLNNLMNILFNALFIFSEVRIAGLVIPALGLGVKGAAMATTLACTITSALLLYTLLGTKRTIRPTENPLVGWDGTIQRSAARLGLPIALERTTLSLGQIVYTKMIGSLGTTALAAHMLATTTESITYLPSSGLSSAATTLTAHSLGAHNKELARRYGSTSIIIGTLLMTLMGVVLYLFATPLLSLFTPDGAVIALGARVLRIEAFAQPGFGLSMLAFGIFRGAGDTRSPFYISLAGMWLFRLPLTWILLTTTTLGLLGVWIAMAGDLTIRGIVCLIEYRRLRWLDIYTEQH